MSHITKKCIYQIISQPSLCAGHCSKYLHILFHFHKKTYQKNSIIPTLQMREFKYNLTLYSKLLMSTCHMEGSEGNGLHSLLYRRERANVAIWMDVDTISLSP